MTIKKKIETKDGHQAREGDFVWAITVWKINSDIIFNPILSKVGRDYVNPKMCWKVFWPCHEECGRMSAKIADRIASRLMK